MKFKTVDGNWYPWDPVGNLKVFFIRDAIKFPDMIHAFKPDPVTNRQEAWRFFDFVSQHPEAIHMVTHLKSPWGIPANYREMEGSGRQHLQAGQRPGRSRALQVPLGAQAGRPQPDFGQASEIQAKDVGHATRDLYDNISKGNFPEWEFCVQIMPDGPNDHLSFDPLDDTKLWPVEDFPLLPVGRMVLDRVPDNFFAEVEQSAFGTGVLVDGIDFSDDKMLQGRTLSYSDTQRYRVGANYLQLPINAPQPGVKVYSNQRDGQMTYSVDGTGPNRHINYEPSTLAEGLREAPKPAKDYHQPVQGQLGRYQTSRTEGRLHPGRRPLPFVPGLGA